MSAELSSHSAEPVSLLITSGAPAAQAARSILGAAHHKQRPAWLARMGHRAPIVAAPDPFQESFDVGNSCQSQGDTVIV